MGAAKSIQPQKSNRYIFTVTIDDWNEDPNLNEMVEKLRAKLDGIRLPKNVVVSEVWHNDTEKFEV